MRGLEKIHRRNPDRIAELETMVDSIRGLQLSDGRPIETGSPPGMRAR